MLLIVPFVCCSLLTYAVMGTSDLGNAGPALEMTEGSRRNDIFLRYSSLNYDRNSDTGMWKEAISHGHCYVGKIPQCVFFVFKVCRVYTSGSKDHSTAHSRIWN